MHILAYEEAIIDVECGSGKKWVLLQLQIDGAIFLELFVVTTSNYGASSWRLRLGFLGKFLSVPCISSEV